ncbi:MAG: putative metal-binding motif-containing protein [Archangium sp.]|nr:putative metal-binding motif-containing protein [Archangium sp.]
MRQVKLLVPAIVASVLSCSTPPATGSALRVAINLEDSIKSTCVALEVKDTGGVLLKTSRGARTQGRMVLSAAIFRDDLPETVALQAIGFSDVDCTMRTVPAEASETITEAFPATSLRDVKVTLKRAPSMSIDVDNDGSPEGTDCDDRDPQRRPGLAEVCTDGKDNDCNDLSDCGDPMCTGKQCKAANSICAGSGLCTETNCADGIDEDQDGTRDCADGECAGKSCANGGTCTRGAMGMPGTCANATNERGLCGDDVDNDGDGMKDCADSDCNLEACSDGLACNVQEICTNNVCGGGVAVSCTASTNTCAASVGLCVEPDGGCVYAPLPADAGCNDGFACTVNDSCDGDGGCAGTPRVCTTPPAGDCWEASGRCDESLDGGCIYDIAVGRLSCADSDPCTVNDACLEDGGCLGAPLDCSNAIPPNECQLSMNQCLVGACLFMNRSGSCDGGTCQAGACVPDPDAGTLVDAGVPADGGALADGGTPVDAGAFADAGAPTDAGASDAGAPFIIPSNVPLATIDAAPTVTHLNFTCNATMTLNPPGYRDDLGCNEPTLPAPTLVPQANGPTLVVYVVDRLTVASGVTVKVVRGSSGGTGDRALVFAVKGDAQINGTIDVSANEGWVGLNYVIESGPGGQGSFCPASSPGIGNGDKSGGGQGGGFGLAGGNGGNGADNGGAGATGIPAQGTATLVPLRGGCPGSRGGKGANDRYGRAGGALQLWVRGQLSLNGALLASGGRGFGAQVTGGGGGGGGSGGAILVEATTLTAGASAIIAANGGSGAEGSAYWPAGLGRDGQYGTIGVTTAPGGSGANQCGGYGGRGGARAGGSTDGQTGGVEQSCNTSNLGGGGGGGGGVGRVRINALNPCTITNGARISPQATSNRTGCSP